MSFLQAKQKVCSWLDTRDKGGRLAVDDIEAQRCSRCPCKLQHNDTSETSLLNQRQSQYADANYRSLENMSPDSEDETYVVDGSEYDEKASSSKMNARIISDAILGLSDGLTVPFALSAGLSAFGNARVVVLGSLAELVAGAISMGLGGYVGAKSEAESYASVKRDTEELVRVNPGKATELLHETLTPFNIPPQRIDDISKSLHACPTKLEQFLLAFHHQETAPDVNQAWISAITLALGYFIGGFIPLIPYFIVDKIGPAFAWSACVMAVTLFVFGYVKTCIVRGWHRREDIMAGLKGAIQMTAVGGIAAGSAMGLVWLINQYGGV